MAKKKPYEDEHETIDVENTDTDTNIETDNTIEDVTDQVEILESNNKVCKILGVEHAKLHVDFDGYGIAVMIKNPEKYNGRKMVRVTYSGVIGTPDFKAWID